MYKDYFGLKEDPFSIAPDPQFLYMSGRHREALAHLIYGMKADSGFVLLTGEVGTGKTTVCRCLLGQIPENSEVAFILNPKLSVIELLATICDELGIAYPVHNQSVKVFIDRILREGDKVTDTIRLEKITADGIILRYDGYRFLLPRRGNR